MNEEKYEGWTNLETWTLFSAIDQDRQMKAHWLEAAEDFLKVEPAEKVHGLFADYMKITLAEDGAMLVDGVYAELLRLAIIRVNSDEIAAWLLREVAQRQAPPSETKSDVIHSSARAQAIADGSLVDVSKLAEKVGFKLPVLMTSAAWKESSQIPDGADYRNQNERLLDVLNVLRPWLRSRPALCDGAEIQVSMFIRTGDVSSEAIEMSGVCESNDDGDLVIKLKLPDEDWL